MDIQSLTKIAGLMSITISSALFSYCLADVNGTTNSEDRFWINRSHQNLTKVENFTAVSEQKLSQQTQPIISHIKFQKPDTFYQQIVQPESLSGIEASYQNNSITLHNPHLQQALIINSLTPFKESSAYARVKGIYLFNKEYYEQVFTPSILVADRLSVGIDLIAEDEASEIKKIEGFVDYHYSLFMQATYLFRNDLSLTTKHMSIEFNNDNFVLPQAKLPKETLITSWDFNNKALSRKEADKHISQDIIWPNDVDNIWDFAEYKYFYNDKNNNRNAAAYFYSDDFFLITIAEAQQEKNYKHKQQTHHKNSAAKALRTIGAPLVLVNTQVWLNQYPSFSTIEFNHLGIHYRLITNIHPESLITLAKGILKKT